MSTAIAAQPPKTAGHKNDDESAVSQYMSFLIEGSNYAIPLTDVAEITPFRELNQMPHMPKDVVGLLDLRGSVLPVISLRSKMGLPQKDTHVNDTILILAHQESRVGILVDLVESVITATEEQHAFISPMLEGKNGVWVRAILLLHGKVILVLEPYALVNLRCDGGEPEEKPDDPQVSALDDMELKLDEGLRNLIALAGSREDGKVIPQLKTIIGHNESELTKVLEKVEAMLVSTDNTFTGITRFKQETAMCGIKAFDNGLTELEANSRNLQDSIFDVINQLQFQDIIRQKLEKVLLYIVGMQDVIANGFGAQSAAAKH